MANAVFIHKNIYGTNDNLCSEGGARAISRDYSIVNDSSINLFIEPYRCGIKDNSGNLLYVTEGCTKTLKSHYTYNICVHKKTKEVCLFIESGINIPSYLPLSKV